MHLQVSAFAVSGQSKETYARVTTKIAPRAM